MVRAREIEQSFSHPASGAGRAARHPACCADARTSARQLRRAGLGGSVAWTLHTLDCDRRARRYHARQDHRPESPELARAGTRGPGEHHPGLSGDQQELQPFILRKRPNNTGPNQMLGILINSLKTGVLTEGRPLGRPASFGFPVIDFSRCTACDECARVCPTGAIHTMPAGADSEICHVVARRLHSVSRVRDPMSGAGRQLLHTVEVAAYTRQQLRAAHRSCRSGHGTWHVHSTGSSRRPNRSGIGRSPPREDPRSTGPVAPRAPGGRRKLQRMRDGDCSDDQPAL